MQTVSLAAIILISAHTKRRHSLFSARILLGDTLNALIIAPLISGGIFTKTCRYLLSSVLLIIIISTAAHCGGNNLLTPEEQIWLNENKSGIVLAVETGYPPFAFLDSKGNPSGLAHDYLLQLESKLGVNFSRKQFSTLDEIFSKVRSGEVLIVNAITKTPSRSEFLSFTEPFITVPNVIIVRNDRSGNMLEKDLAGLKVSLVKSYAITEHLSKTETGIVADIVPNDLTAILNVSFGQSDAAVIDLATASYLLSQKGITNLRVAGEASQNIQLSIAVPRSKTTLHKILQKTLTSFTETERHRIQDRWIQSAQKDIFTDWRFRAVVGSALFVICSLLIGSFLWNKLLHRQVELRTIELKEEQEALRESEAYNRMLFDQSPIGLALTQIDGKLVDVNQAYADIIGRTVDEAFNLTYWDITPEKYALQEQEQLTALKAAGEYGPYEKEYIHKDGHLVPVRLQGLLIERKGEKYIWSSVEDITNRKTIESVQSFISERGWCLWEEEFFPALARFLSETLSMEFACIDRLTGDGLMAHTVAVYHNGRFEDNVDYALKDTPCGDVVGKTICCFPRDVANLFPNDPVLREIKAESYAGITLYGKNEEPIGLIALIGEKPFLNQQLVETVLQYIAQRAAGELERQLADEALHESEALFRSYYELGLIGMAITSLEKGWVQCNDCLCSMLGYTQEELSNKSWAELTHPDDLAADEAQFQLVLHGEIDGYQIEKRFIRNEGGIIHTDLSVKCVRNEDGSPKHFIAMIKDITRQKKEERLAAARLYLVEYSLSHTLNELLTATLDQIEELTGSQIGYFHLLQEDQRTLTLHAWSTRTARDFCKAEGAGSHYDIDKAGVWVDCIHQRQPVIHNDYASLPHRKGMPPGHATVTRELAVPILRSDKIVGILGIGNKASEYSEEDVLIAYRFADLAWDIAERKQMQDSLSESNELFITAFNSAPIMITISSIEDGTYLDANQQFQNISGFSREEVIGKTSVELGWISEADRMRLKESIQQQGKIQGQELSLHTKAGLTKLCKYWGEVISVTGQQRLLSIALDITEQHKAEQQLHQVQKMESIGSLAGGVAHDFNNMLTVIMGHVQLGLMESDINHPVCEHLTEIMKTAERSADLTRQLLAFARKQAIAPKNIDLNEVINGMLKMLRRLIGESIQLTWQPAPDLWRIKADPSQIDQILANLCVNGRDAINGTGRITIETRNNTVDSSYCEENPEAVPGDYVHLSVSDDGSGMDKETMARVFEPFFTTKGVGEGTGLGLATVYGIVKQNDGFINIYSEPGMGTTFTIHLPRLEEKSQKSQTEAKAAPLPKGQETILLVEDEPGILQITSLLLGMQGYTLLTAGTPDEAIRLAHEHAGEINLLITDVIMPKMNGKDLANKLQSLNPQLKCLYMSGYTADIIAQHGVLDEGVHFIQKPFSLPNMATMVREVLDSKLIRSYTEKSF